MVVFSDGFESGNFNVWSQAVADGSGSVAVNSSNPYEGTYGAVFTAGGVNGYAEADKEGLTSASTYYLRAYYKFASGLPSSNEDRIVLGGVMASEYTYGAFVTIKRIDGELYWGINHWENSVEQNTFEATASNPTTGQWYCIEIKRDVTSDAIQLWVDGVSKLSVSRSISGNSNLVAVGCGWKSYAASAVMYVDSVVVDTDYIGPIQTYTLTITVSGSGTTNPSAGTHNIAAGTYQSVSAIAGEGYTFDHWMLDDNNVGSTNPYSVQMNSNHTLQAVFTGGGGGDLTVTGNLTVNGSTTAEEGLTSNDTIFNKGHYNIIDTDGSTWINAMLTANTAPDSDFHFVPNYSTQSQGTSKVYFGYDSDWGSYNWMFGKYPNITTVMKLNAGFLDVRGTVALNGGTSSVPGLWFTTGAPSGASWGGSLGIGLNNANEIVLNAYKIKTARTGTVNNTLDDGSGNMTITGQVQLPAAGSSGGIVTNGKVEMTCTAPYFSTWEGGQNPLKPYLWGLEYYGGQWHWTADGTTLQLGDSFIRFKDTAYPNNTVDIGIIRGPQEPEDPMLWISRHLVVKKDFLCGGAATVLQGALVLGSDWDANNPNGQMPQIMLVHSESAYNNRDTLQIWRAGYAGWGNLRAGWVQATLLTSDGNVSIGHLETSNYIPLYLDQYGVVSRNSSTIRGKENVQELPDCSWLYDLRSVSFDWKDQKRAQLEGTQMGLIAEEVHEVCPNLTWLDKEGKPEGVHYEWLGIPLLVEVKKLRNRIEVLENQLKQNRTATQH